MALNFGIWLMSLDWQSYQFTTFQLPWWPFSLGGLFYYKICPDFHLHYAVLETQINICQHSWFLLLYLFPPYLLFVCINYGAISLGLFSKSCLELYHVALQISILYADKDFSPQFESPQFRYCYHIACKKQVISLGIRSYGARPHIGLLHGVFNCSHTPSAYIKYNYIEI